MNCIFVLSGNCRTFIDCIDSIYQRIISKMFDISNTHIYIYMYLKLTDPGPKGQTCWDFSYNDVDKKNVIDKIDQLIKEYNIKIDYKLLDTDEIPNEELLSQIKDLSKYVGYFKMGNLLVRSIQCHYNFEMCGKYIEEKEKQENITFDYIIYVRPDLYFTQDCQPICKYDSNLVTAGYHSAPNNYDHIAIIPRKNFVNFFYDRMNVYRNNTTKYYDMAENVYFSTINYKLDHIGQYYIKRT